MLLKFIGQSLSNEMLSPKYFLGGSPGLVVMGKTRVPKVVGSNPGAINWMDMTIFHIDLL